MAKPLKNMNNQAQEIARESFKDLLRKGAFPKVQYAESDGQYGGKNISYSMIEYSTVWATYAKIVQKNLVESGFEFGLWTNARNSKYLKAVEEAVKDITEKQVNESSERFQTIFG